MILGQGSYGQVIVRDGLAIKKFSKLSYLIQEYIALKYLQDCQYVVHAHNLDCQNLELHMELYDNSLRQWWDNFVIKRSKDEQRFTEPFLKNQSKQEIIQLLHDVLLGLIELHDRGLAHGDLKPGNILVRKRPLKAVLGDCGFVSIAKYSKLERCAQVYRDPEIQHDLQHDMFSFGICCLELLGDVKIRQQSSYQELKPLIKSKIADPHFCKIITSLVHYKREKRPTARQVLKILFHEDPPKWVRPPTVISGESSMSAIDSTISPDHKIELKNLMKHAAYEYQINRAKRGYSSLICFIVNNEINHHEYKFYGYLTLLILAAIFGTNNLSINDVQSLLKNKYDLSQIHRGITRLVNDPIFVKVLLAPSKEE